MMRRRGWEDGGGGSVCSRSAYAVRAESEEGDDEDVEGGEVEEEHADEHHLQCRAGMVLLQHLRQREDVGEEEVAGHDHHLDLQAQSWRGNEGGRKERRREMGGMR